jgi:hypothetical protein
MAGRGRALAAKCLRHRWPHSMSAGPGLRGAGPSCGACPRGYVLCSLCHAGCLPALASIQGPESHGRCRGRPAACCRPWDVARQSGLQGIALKTETIVRRWSAVAVLALGCAGAQAASVVADCRWDAPGKPQVSGRIPTLCARGDDLGGFGRPSGEPLRLGPESSSGYDLDRDFQPRPWPESMRPREPHDTPDIRRFPTPVPSPGNPPLRVPGTSDFPWLRPPAQPGIR